MRGFTTFFWANFNLCVTVGVLLVAWCALALGSAEAVHGGLIIASIGAVWSLMSVTVDRSPSP